MLLWWNDTSMMWLVLEFVSTSAHEKAGSCKTKIISQFRGCSPLGTHLYSGYATVLRYSLRRLLTLNGETARVLVMQCLIVWTWQSSLLPGWPVPPAESSPPPEPSPEQCSAAPWPEFLCSELPPQPRWLCWRLPCEALPAPWHQRHKNPSIITANLLHKHITIWCFFFSPVHLDNKTCFETFYTLCEIIFCYIKILLFFYFYLLALKEWCCIQKSLTT